MENERNVKRSIRIPKDIHKELEEMAKYYEVSVNQVILEIIKEKIG